MKSSFSLEVHACEILHFPSRSTHMKSYTFPQGPRMRNRKFSLEYDQKLNRTKPHNHNRLVPVSGTKLENRTDRIVLWCTSNILYSSSSSHPSNITNFSLMFLQWSQGDRWEQKQCKCRNKCLNATDGFSKMTKRKLELFHGFYCDDKFDSQGRL